MGALTLALFLQFSLVLKWPLGQLSTSVITEADDTFSEWSALVDFLPLICDVMPWAIVTTSAYLVQPHSTKGSLSDSEAVILSWSGKNAF